MFVFLLKQTGGGNPRGLWNIAVIVVFRIWLLTLLYFVVVSAECKECIKKCVGKYLTPITEKCFKSCNSKRKKNRTLRLQAI